MEVLPPRAAALFVILFQAVAFAAWAPAAAAGAAPLTIGNQKQLFFDTRFIAAQENVELRMNPPQKLGLILDAEGRPSEKRGHISRVLDIDGKVRMYVGADRLEILESEDGLHFRETGQTVSGGELTTVSYDPHDPDPARRYKIFWVRLTHPFDPAQDGVYGAASADGINWTTSTRVLPRYIDNPILLEWDARVGKYVVFTRTFSYDSPNQRRIARLEMDDPLQPWPIALDADSRERLSTQQATPVLEADAQDNPHSDIYYNSGGAYPWAADTWLMFTAPFRHFSPQRNPAIVPPNGNWEDFGLLEGQLAVSRDGSHWERPSREPYIATGLVDEWDRWYIVTAPGLVRRGNWIYQYYYSSGRTHDSANVRPEYADSAPRLGGIGVVRQRLDGFVSADVDYRGGWLLTPPLLFQGSQLRLNIDTGAMGIARVELRDAAGQPLPGFALDDCEEIGGNYPEERVHWKGNPDLAALAGVPVQIYFELSRAKLFAFQFLD